MAAVLVPGVLMFTTEGPDADFGSPAANLTAAWGNLTAIVVFGAAQLAALAAWRLCAWAVRTAAGGRFRGARAYRSHRIGRLALKGCAVLLILTAWTAEAGYVTEAVTCVSAGGWDEPVSALP